VEIILWPARGNIDCPGAAVPTARVTSTLAGCSTLNPHSVTYTTVLNPVPCSSDGIVPVDTIEKNSALAIRDSIRSRPSLDSSRSHPVPPTPAPVPIGHGALILEVGSTWACIGMASNHAN